MSRFSKYIGDTGIIARFRVRQLRMVVLVDSRVKPVDEIFKTDTVKRQSVVVKMFSRKFKGFDIWEWARKTPVVFRSITPV